MWLTNVSIKRPLFISMVILALVIMGAVAYSRIGTELYPNVNLPIVVVVVAYPGAAPEEVESKVTKPIEDAVAGATHVKSISSFSMENISVVQLEFKDGTDSNFAAVDVERRVNMVRATLPPAAKAPSVVRAEMNALPIMSLVLTGKSSKDDLYRLAEDKLRPRLETVKGVASINLAGGRYREIRVELDQARLHAKGLSAQQVVGVLSQANISVPAGRIEEDGRTFSVRYDSLYRTVDELRALIISSGPTGTVYLRDVAMVEDTFKAPTLISRYYEPGENVQDSVSLILTKQSDANTIQVANEVKKAVAEVERSLPADVRIVVATDQATYVRRSLDDIQLRLGEAVLLTGIVLLLFLHTFRSTLIVLFSIPTSLVATFLVMWMLGFTMNIMSMLALALTVGILVDDSIVVLENIFRHLRLGETPWSAALNGRSEIGLAAIAITLVDVVVYTPIAFMSGIAGQFFRQFGLTVATATLFSLFISFTLTPMLASRWLKPDKREHRRSPLARFGDLWEAGFDRIAMSYRQMLSWSLHHRKTVVAVGTIVFALTLLPLLLGLISFEMMPTEDQGEFHAILEMPPGTSLDATSRATEQLEAKIATIPEVVSYLVTVGTGGTLAGVDQGRNATIAVKLTPKGERKRSATAVGRQVEAMGDEINGATVRTQIPSIFVGGSAQPFLVQVRGDDPATVKEVAAKVADVVRGIPGTSNVTNSATVGSPELVVKADARRMAELGITPAQTAQALRGQIEGSVVTTMETEGKAKIDVRVIGAGNDRVSTLTSLPVAVNPDGVVRLDQVSTLIPTNGPAEIQRSDRQRSVLVGADLLDRALGDVTNDFRAALNKSPLPPGYSTKIIGEAETMDESFTDLFMALVLSVLLMYMLMVALFESLLYPFIIMFALPLSIAGAFLGLLISGSSLSMATMIGMIMLMGLVGKNAILLVDYTNTLRRQGHERLQALLEAGPTRLRPILMTTSAMVLAMSPLALARGDGSESSAPMAAVVIGGLLSSTLLTLVLVPVIYTILDDAQAIVTGRRKAVPDKQGAMAMVEP